MIKPQIFFQRVYAVVNRIPKGRVATYGQIARIIGTRDARRVGHALHANNRHECPCHRVVFSDGSLASGFAFGGLKEQQHLLEGEGVSLQASGKVNLKLFLWQSLSLR